MASNRGTCEEIGEYEAQTPIWEELAVASVSPERRPNRTTASWERGYTPAQQGVWNLRQAMKWRSSLRHESQFEFEMQTRQKTGSQKKIRQSKDGLEVQARTHAC